MIYKRIRRGKGNKKKISEGRRNQPNFEQTDGAKLQNARVIHHFVVSHHHPDQRSAVSWSTCKKERKRGAGGSVVRVPFIVPRTRC